MYISLIVIFSSVGTTERQHPIDGFDCLQIWYRDGSTPRSYYYNTEKESITQIYTKKNDTIIFDFTSFTAYVKNSTEIFPMQKNVLGDKKYEYVENSIFIRYPCPKKIKKKVIKKSRNIPIVFDVVPNGPIRQRKKK